MYMVYLDQIIVVFWNVWDFVMGNIWGTGDAWSRSGLWETTYIK